MFLQVERHGLICVSVNNKMLLLVILLSLTLSCIWFENDLTLWTNTAIELSDILFSYYVKKVILFHTFIFNQCIFINLDIRFFEFPYIIKIIIKSYPTESGYIWHVPNDFWFRWSNLITPCSRFKSWILWTVDIHANGNWLRLMDRDAIYLNFYFPFLSRNPRNFFCLNNMIPLLSSNSDK